MKNYPNAVTRFLFLCLGFYLVSAFVAMKGDPVRRRLRHVIQVKPAFLPDGFSIDVPENQLPKPPKKPFRVTSVAELKDLFRQGYRVRDFDVRGDTRVVSDTVHPVVKALYDRKEVDTYVYIPRILSHHIFMNAFMSV